MTQVQEYTMQEKPIMDGYYYSFKATGVREVDQILSAVAIAGRHHHHTEGWEDVNMLSDDEEYFSCVDLIQEMANRAAKSIQEQSR